MSDQRRVRAGAAALAVAPLLTLAAVLVQDTPAHDTGSELASIAAHPTSYQVASMLGFVALTLMLPGLLTMARPLWQDRSRWALTGLTLSLSGLVGLASLMGSGPAALAMAQADDRAVMVAVTDAYESSLFYGLWVALLILGYSLGPVVLGLGLWRAGFSRVVPALLLIGLALMMVESGRLLQVAAYGASWCGFALAAHGIWCSTHTPPAVRDGSRTLLAQPVE